MCGIKADFGEFCSSNNDCMSPLATCSFNKCIRTYSRQKGESCTLDNECYRGTCNNGFCVDLTIGDVPNFSNCPGYTVCGGQPSSKTPGRCADTCMGPQTDVASCISNLGVPFQEFNHLFTPSIASGQYYDPDSTIYNSCMTQFQRYYSCLAVNLNNAGIGGNGPIGNLDLTVYSNTSYYII